LKTAIFRSPERPLSGKADIRPETSKIWMLHDRFNPGSGRWAIIGLKGR